MLEAAEELMAWTVFEAGMVPELVVLKEEASEVVVGVAVEQERKEEQEKYVRFRTRFWLPAWPKTVRDVHS